jgi:preprotein translocase SecE subunit
MANPLARVSALVTEIQQELKQVSWPSREELLGSALVVFVGVFLLAIFIWACDFVLSHAAQHLLEWGTRQR